MNTINAAIGSTLTIALALCFSLEAKSFTPVVEVEEEVYRYAPANNGAGPMWCRGSTCIVRYEGSVFVSGLKTIPDAKPLNNCVPLLYHRDNEGWHLIYEGQGRTREPSPLVLTPDARVLMSVNPTLTPQDTYSGPAQPRILAFSAGKPASEFRKIYPQWEGEPKFTEHSYRSFAADGVSGTRVLFQNIGYTHVEWAFQDRQGHWRAQGRLAWPWGAEYDEPQPIRVCYPTVALNNRAVYFCGVSDIIEPYKKWRDYKYELTGQKWDYDFRRLFFTWSSDITTGKFHPWMEIASRDQTCGWISPQDLYVSPSGDVLILWTERAVDERLRETFFPETRQRYSLESAVVRNGQVIRRTTILEGGEGLGSQRPGDARIHVTPQGRVLIFCHIGNNRAGQAGNYIIEALADGTYSRPESIDLAKPITRFFTSTPRAGNEPSIYLDVLGNSGNTMRYIRIRLEGS